VQHPEAPDQLGISPDQPGEAPAQRGSSWEPPPHQPLPAIGKGKTPPSPEGKEFEMTVLLYGKSYISSRSRETPE